jgi:hypothetical protein
LRCKKENLSLHCSVVLFSDNATSSKSPQGILPLAPNASSSVLSSARVKRVERVDDAPKEEATLNMLANTKIIPFIETLKKITV